MKYVFKPPICSKFISSIIAPYASAPVLSQNAFIKTFWLVIILQRNIITSVTKTPANM